jgi:hypothetical protein
MHHLAGSGCYNSDAGSAAFGAVKPLHPLHAALDQWGWHLQTSIHHTHLYVHHGELENIVSEISQVWKAKGLMFSLICGK